MRRLLKYTTLILMVLLLSGSVWANTYTDHITTAPNNKGDVLIFPWFMAIDGGWQTKLTVINTDEVNSVVAKLIIRSFKNSEELLDFFLYLSPADVWTGIIRYNSALGKVVIYSDDDSALSQIVPSLVWANVTPINQPMFPLTCSDDSEALGYVEIIEAATGPVAPATPGVAKLSIYNAYAALLLGTAGPLYFVGDLPQVYNTVTVNRTNSLAGFMQFQNVTSGLDAALQSTTLKDYANLEPMTTGAETRIGADALNNLLEVEASISKDDVALPYVKGNDIALHMFTFPTKLTDVASCGTSAPDSPYFVQNGDLDYCLPYTVVTYDLQEHYPLSGSPFSGGGTSTNRFCNEVNFVASTLFEYAEGWAHYAFGDFTVGVNNTLQYLAFDGTPVIPTYFYIGASGLSANYGAWTDDLVYGLCTATTISIPDYQYTDATWVGVCP